MRGLHGFLAMAVCVTALSGRAVMAQDGNACAEAAESFHVTDGEEDLFVLAERFYDDPDKWTVILAANRAVLGGSAFGIDAGVRLRIPCLDIGTRPPEPSPLATLPAPEQSQEPRRRAGMFDKLRILTGGDYEPFTEQDLENGGLVTELVNRAFASTSYSVEYDIFWNDNWAEHLELLRSGTFDMGFPWLRPNCADDPGQDRCRNFHFSKPVFEMMVMLFSRVDDPIGFESDDDVLGKTICRPAGYYLHDLDRSDRRWVSEERIVLRQPDTPEECFRMLVRGEVDAVSLNEFTGRSYVKSMGLSDCVTMERTPISIEGLHVIAARVHPRATTHLYRFDEGVETLLGAQEYNEIFDRHLSNYWNSIENISPESDGCTAG